MSDKDKEKDKEKDKDKDSTAASHTAGEAKMKKPLALMVALPLLGAAAGFGATLAIPRPPAQGEGKAEPEIATASFMLPEIKANLARSGGLHFCAVDIFIQIKSQKMDAVAHRFGIQHNSGGGHGGGATAQVQTLANDWASVARDRIILLLNGKSIDDLEGREKKELLKKEIKQELESVLFPRKDGEIEAVLFKDILIQ